MIGSALVDRTQRSDNHEARPAGSRISLLVLHYTGMKSGPAAVDWLCNPASRVSCHYLIDCDGEIVQMVSEDRRAWHAGVSFWLGDIDTNSRSIGIEIQNEGHVAGCPPFPDVQMKRVMNLCLDIMCRHGLRPQDVVAHSDIAPGRKIDPGEAFDWRFLAENGIGQYVFSAHENEKSGHDMKLGLSLLEQLGYGIRAAGADDSSARNVVQAFQRRYRPKQVDGTLDRETLNLVERLAAIQPTEAVDCRV